MEQAWQSTRATDTITAYRFFLSEYGDSNPHAFEARMRISELEEITKQLYIDLFDDMRENMLKFNNHVMEALFGRVPPTDEQLQ